MHCILKKARSERLDTKFNTIKRLSQAKIGAYKNLSAVQTVCITYKEMYMGELKKDSEILAEIYLNAQLGITSIVDIMPEIDDESIKEEIMREHEEYERIRSEAANLARKYNLELKEPSPMKKAMMWSAIKMGTASDNSAQNVAQMMLKGTVQGITSLRTSLTDGELIMDAEVKKLLTELIDLEEGFEKKLKTFL